MDALILSCGTGGGHNSAGKAILEEMKKRGHHAKMLNPYMLKSNRLSNGIDRTYIATARNTPKAFGAIYRIGNSYRRLPFHSPVYFVNRGMDKIMQEYFTEHHFDVVIMPHLFPAEIMTNMKRHGISIPKTIFVATDYVCIPFTEETECDAYIIPAKDLTEDFIKRGLPKEKLYPFGIPTRNCFAANEPRREVKKRLRLAMEKKYILIAGGSMGGGNIENAISKIQYYFSSRKDIELIIVCGSNQNLFQKLKEQNNAGITVIGQCDDMSSYMKACDLFITKPGGLSSTEAAVCGIPILHTSPIPGCESYNADYFSKHGMSIYGEITEELLHIAEELIRNESMRTEMIACQKKFINPYAAVNVCDFAEKICR